MTPEKRNLFQNATKTLLIDIPRLETQLACSLFFWGLDNNDWQRTWNNIQATEVMSMDFVSAIYKPSPNFPSS